MNLLCESVLQPPWMRKTVKPVCGEGAKEVVLGLGLGLGWFLRETVLCGWKWKIKEVVGVVVVEEFESFLGKFEASFKKTSLCIFDIFMKALFGGFLGKFQFFFS